MSTQQPTKQTVEIGDKLYVLTIDFNTLAEVEDLTGLSLLSGGFWKDLNVRTLRTIMWIFMKPEEPALTIEQAGARLGVVGIKVAIDIFTSALAGVMPEVDPNDPLVQKVLALVDQAGMSSGPSDDTTSDSPTPNSGA